MHSLVELTGVPRDSYVSESLTRNGVAPKV